MIMRMCFMTCASVVDVRLIASIICCHFLCLSADGYRPVVGSTASNSSSSGYSQPRSAARSPPHYTANVTQSQQARAGQTKSISEQNPSNQRQTNQISANAGVQRGPRVPSVRISHFFLVNHVFICC